MSRLFRRISAALAAAIAIPMLTAPAAAQCEPEWRSLRGGVEGARYGQEPAILAFQEFDDGSGRALYAGGVFRSAGGAPASNVARWDGWSWSPVGSGVSGWIREMVVFDDGSGPALYAALMSASPFVVRWDGRSWTTVGEVGPNWRVQALAVFDDGSGAALYAGGLFTSIDGKPIRRIARWDGSSWTSVGGGVSETVRAMTVFDDGSGPALYVAGQFSFAGGLPVQKIARWDGQSWSSMGDESDQRLTDCAALEVFDDGGGPALYAAAFILDSAGARGGVLRWDGHAWQEVGGRLGDWPYALEVIDDGSGPALFAGGRFTSIGGEPIEYLARWDGASWSGFQGGTDGPVRAITTFDEGAGPTIFIGGDFTRAGDIEVSGIAAFGCPPPSCYADCNDDGQLNIFDFLCFQNLFAAGDPAADCDGSGSLDFADFLCYQDAFAAGCP